MSSVISQCLYLKRFLHDELGLGLVHLPHARGRLAQLRPTAVGQGAAHEIPARRQNFTVKYNADAAEAEFAK